MDWSPTPSGSPGCRCTNPVRLAALPASLAFHKPPRHLPTMVSRLLDDRMPYPSTLSVAALSANCSAALYYSPASVGFPILQHALSSTSHPHQAPSASSYKWAPKLSGGSGVMLGTLCYRGRGRDQGPKTATRAPSTPVQLTASHTTPPAYRALRTAIASEHPFVRRFNHLAIVPSIHLLPGLRWRS